jgi:hypothetical protein
MEMFMETVAHQKSIHLSSNTISDIITTGTFTINKDHLDNPKCEFEHLSLMNMSDIEFLNKISGATLVFDASINRFVLEPIPFINGGSF